MKENFPEYAINPQEANYEFVRGRGELIPLTECKGRIALEGALPYRLVLYVFNLVKNGMILLWNISCFWKKVLLHFLDLSLKFKESFYRRKMEKLSFIHLLLKNKLNQKNKSDILNLLIYKIIKSIFLRLIIIS